MASFTTCFTFLAPFHHAGNPHTRHGPGRSLCLHFFCFEGISMMSLPASELGCVCIHVCPARTHEALFYRLLAAFQSIGDTMLDRDGSLRRIPPYPPVKKIKNKEEEGRKKMGKNIYALCTCSTGRRTNGSKSTPPLSLNPSFLLSNSAGANSPMQEPFPALTCRAVHRKKGRPQGRYLHDQQAWGPQAGGNTEPWPLEHHLPAAVIKSVSKSGIHSFQGYQGRIIEKAV